MEEIKIGQPTAHINSFTEYQNEVNKKMKKPTTQLEKNALKEAKKEIIATAVEKKSVTYKLAMNDFMYNENKAQMYREKADKQRDILGITDKEMKELF